MIFRPRFSLLAAFVLLVAMTACSDNGSGPPPGDTTPPAIASVTPVDVTHFEVTFNEAVTKSSAQDNNNYKLVEVVTAQTIDSSAASPGDSLLAGAAVLLTDQRTVSITTWTPLNGLTYTLSVTGVADLHGNQIITAAKKLFIASNQPDTTPPYIVSQSPAPGATGIPIGTQIEIQFSEAILGGNAAWTSPSGPVGFYRLGRNNSTALLLDPSSLPGYDQTQTISLTGFEDQANNVMPDVEWSFHTTSVVDNTPPTVVSTVPANLATGVDVGTNIQITFSEPMSPRIPGLYASPGFLTTPTWSDDGRTLTLDPSSDLSAGQQYTLTLAPNDVSDLNGNPMTNYFSWVFTTGDKLNDGSIAGTVTGDPGTPAADPAGAAVLLQTYTLFGATTVTANGTYLIEHVPDGSYPVVAIMDTNGDHYYYPWWGDAIGGYGLDVFQGLYDTVTISGGNHASGIDFSLYDVRAVKGRVSYDGAYASANWPVYVGLFDAESFDPNNLDSQFATQAHGYDLAWYVDSVDQGFPDGDYYVGAYVDVNNDGYQAGVDPVGMYGGFDTPTVLHLVNGNDYLNITIPITDPVPAASPAQTATVHWRTPRPDPRIQQLFEMIRKSMPQTPE